MDELDLYRGDTVTLKGRRKKETVRPCDGARWCCGWRMVDPATRLTPPFSLSPPLSSSPTVLHPRP